jgi:hypothetical protein
LNHSNLKPFLWIFFFFFLRYWDLKAGLHLKPLHQHIFCDVFFWDRSHELFTWAEFVTFLISDSWVASITGMSHQHLTFIYLFLVTFCCCFFLFCSFWQYWELNSSTLLFELLRQPPLFLLGRVSLCSQPSLELTILLPQPPKH